MKLGILSFLLAVFTVIVGRSSFFGFSGSIPLFGIYLLLAATVIISIFGIIKERGGQRALSILALLIVLLSGAYIFFVWNYAPKFDI